MKLFIASDLHLEFGQYTHKFPEADIALLAGDICVPGLWKRNYKHLKDVEEFFLRLSNHFPQTFIILGNHEHYHGEFISSGFRIKGLLNMLGIKNIYLLDKQHVELSNNLWLFGATFWTDFNNNNPIDMERARVSMNDFRICNYDEETPFTPKLAYEDYKKTLTSLIKGPFDIVMSHHAPSFQSVDKRYKNSGLNSAYASNLEDTILLTQPKLWVHGHMHSSNDYTIGGTRVISNPRGYHGYAENPDFNPQLVVET